MKQKSTSKKPFRYVPFSERIEKISSDAARLQIAFPNEKCMEESYFHNAIAKWNEMDYNSHLQSFLSDLPNGIEEIRSYAQLLYHQEAIFDSIMKNIKIVDDSGKLIYLELSVAFARDLRDDLYPYLWQLFDVVVGIIEEGSEKVEILEAAFTAMAVFLKLQWRRIVRELRRTFVRFIRLFSSNRGYLRRFAAEAFAFLLRKSNRIYKLAIYLTGIALKERDDSLIDGISQLYFYAMKGVMRQFHSCSIQLLSTILDATFSFCDNASREIAAKILEGYISRCISYTTSEHSLPILNLLLNKFSQSFASDSIDNSILLSRMLVLWITGKKGKLVSNASIFFSPLMDSVKSKNWKLNNQFISLLSAILRCFDRDESCRASIGTVLDSLVDKATIEDVDVMLHIFRALMGFSIFDIWLMPTVGKYSNKILYALGEDWMNHVTTMLIFRFYAELCLNKRPITLVKRGISCTFFDVSHHSELRRKSISVIKFYAMLEDFSTNMELMVYVCNIYPWLWRQAENLEANDVLVELLQLLLRRGIDCRGILDSISWKRQYFSLSLSIINAISIVDCSLLKKMSLNDIDCFMNNVAIDEYVLHMMYIILPHTSDFHCNGRKFFPKVLAALSESFGHPHASVRQLALEVLRHFVDINGMESISEMRSAIDILLEGERTPLSLEYFRERIRLFCSLRYADLRQHLPSSLIEKFETVPLRVIIAQFFVNFTIIWPHLFEVIESYAVGMEIDIFWPVFESFLLKTNESIAMELNQNILNTRRVTASFEVLTNLNRPTPNYFTFRLQLIKAMTRFSRVCERRTHFLTPILIHLYQKEYQNHVFISRVSEDITVPSNKHQSFQSKFRTADDIVEHDCEKIVQNESEFWRKQKRKKSPKDAMDEASLNKNVDRKVIKQTIVALLEAYSHFSSPKTVFMANEVRNLLLELLTLGDDSVQQISLKCIFKFSDKVLNLYRENLENILNDRTFADEIVRFAIDGSEAVVVKEHRSEVLPVLIRMLLGKINHTGNGNDARRGVVFRFLAGCLPEEIDLFIQLLFAPVLKSAGGANSVREHGESVIKEFNPKSMTPLNKLQGSLVSISHVLNKLSPSLDVKQKQFILRLCLTIGITVRLALANIDSIEFRNVKILKTLKKDVSRRFKEMFFAFQSWKYGVEEISSIFDFYIIPSCFISGFSVVAPLSVLRLFFSWTELPKLWYLLRVRMLSNDSEETPISILFNSLLSSSSSVAIRCSIIEAVLNLLNYADEDDTEVPEGLNVVDIELVEGVNLGTSLILPQLPKLLQYLLETFPAQNSKKKIDPKLLTILNKLSGFVKDATVSEHFVLVFLIYVSGIPKRNEEMVQSFLSTAAQLIPSVEDPKIFLSHLAHLYSSMTSRNSQEALSLITNAIALRVEGQEAFLAQALFCLVDLNSWNRQKIDEPDYERRHAALSRFGKMLSAGFHVDLDLDVLKIFFHNSFSSIMTVNDIALRSAASLNLDKLFNYIGNDQYDKSSKWELLETDFIPFIIKGLNSEQEVVRHNFVSVLVCLIKAFPSNRYLKSLKQLYNADDIELDFFENITHLQIHRRQRAFRRLAHNLANNQLMSFDTLHRFILPILRPYIIDYTSKTAALSDEAIHLFTVIMRSAPWKRYYPMMDYYIKQMSKENVNHKAIIRVIVALVEAFHFAVGISEKFGSNAVIEQSEITCSGNNSDTDPCMNLGFIPENSDSVNEGLKSNSDCNEALGKKIDTYFIRRLKDCACGKDLTMHRKAGHGKYYNEENAIQRAPIALATVKLLLKLPERLMSEHLHGIVLKLCDLLISRLVSVRDKTRKVIINICQCLGPKYLPFIIKEIKLNLRKGYQVHVMIFSIQLIISAMESSLSPGDIDSCLQEIIEVCNSDLFGDVASMKEVAGIIRDTPEAKSSRTYGTYTLLGRFISTSCIGKVIAPLKHILENYLASGTSKKVSRILKNFAVGLNGNAALDPPVLLILVHQMLQEHIKDMMNKENIIVAKETESMRREESCLILEKEPERIGYIINVSVRGKVFVFVEFALNLFHLSLKSRKFSAQSSDDVARLDHFIDFLLKCFTIKYGKIICNSLRCYLLLLKYPLPSIHRTIKYFIDRLFVMLSEYTGVNAHNNKDGALELSQLIFKTFTILIRDAPNLIISSERLEVLLSHVEADILDSQRQATAFSLIKSIASSKLQNRKLPELVRYLCELAITSEISHVRVQCRQVLSKFAGKHPQSKPVEFYVQFFLNQIHYEHEDGRLSALEMLDLLFENVAKESSNNCWILSYVKMATGLVNEKSENGHRLLTLAIRRLLSSAPDSVQNDLYLMTTDWLETKNSSKRCIAMQALAEFAQSKGDVFFKTRSKLYQSMLNSVTRSYCMKYTERSCIFVLKSLALILQLCVGSARKHITHKMLSITLKELSWVTTNSESSKVHLAVLQLAGSFFSMFFSPETNEFDVIDPTHRSLLDWMFSQLRKPTLDDALALEISKNISTLWKNLTSLADIEWVCKRLRSICMYEIVRQPNESMKRLSIFKLSAALSLQADQTKLEIICDGVLPLLFREIQGKSNKNTEELQELANQVAEVFKGRLSEEDYTKRMKDCQLQSAAKFEIRKRKQEEEVVVDPVGAALKKQKRNKSKAFARKRKFDTLKPHRVAARKREELRTE